MPILTLSDLPYKFPASDDLTLIQSGANLYKAFVGDLRPQMPAPVDLSEVSSNYILSPGQSAYRAFNSATYVDLPIAVIDGAIYRMIFAYHDPPGSTSYSGTTMVRLLPNYTALPGAFTYSGFTSSGALSPATTDGLALGWRRASFQAFIYAKPSSATSVSHGGATSGYSWVPFLLSSVYTGSGLSWVSLGRLAFGTTLSGLVYIRREA